MSTRNYVGGELSLFAQARNWKRYFGRHLRQALVGDVLEVGAGLGETTRALCDGRQSAWTCLEPDPALGAQLSRTVAGLGLRTPVRVVTGTLADLPPEQRFDAVIYIDVLEHIADDRAELMRAEAHLKPGGRLVVLAPAHMALFSEFDRAIGHHRRYNRAMLSAVAPPGVVKERLFYLDAVGMLCSLANRVLLRQAQPSLGAILFWDRVLVPVSRVVDVLLGYALGRSVIGIWRMPAGAGEST
ncbi:MAG: class I SAM-dependent methyltransferase [Verrucomicrobia bacterium]|nr:class I SAM-dependent methyltransferase [Verrucomicrobiota bacterium]